MVDQGDVQYFIGVQLDGTERVREAAAKDGAILVCFYLNGDQHICAIVLAITSTQKNENKMPDNFVMAAIL